MTGTSPHGQSRHGQSQPSPACPGGHIWRSLAESRRQQEVCTCPSRELPQRCGADLALAALEQGFTAHADLVGTPLFRRVR